MTSLEASVQPSALLLVTGPAGGRDGMPSGIQGDRSQGFMVTAPLGINAFNGKV